MKRFASFPFNTKLIISFIVTLVVTLSFITVMLTNVANQRTQEDNKAYLSLLTEQVLINFEQSMSSVEKQLYNSCDSLNIPTKMLAVTDNHASTYTVRDLQYSVNQMVSTILPFSFVMVQTTDGVEVHTGGKHQNGDSLAAKASELLNSGLNENTYGRCVWQRTEDGSIYVIRDVLQRYPLKHVGKVIARLPKDKLFTLGEEVEQFDCTLLFFNKDKEHVLTIGSMDNEQQELIAKSMSSKLGKESPNENVEIWNNTSYYYTVSRHKAWNAVGLIPMSRFDGLRSTIISTSLLVSVIGLLTGVFLVTLLTRGLSRQLSELIKSMDVVAKGDMSHVVPIQSQDDIGQLAVHFNEMIREISELMQRVVEEEKNKKAIEFQLLEYRFRSLQAEINPHFIYNALETVNALAKLSDNTEIVDVVQLICRYFRQCTRSKNFRFINLRQEFCNLNDFADIYGYIYGERLLVRFELPEAACEALIPTMILQPVLENALKHGISNTEEQSLVVVSARIDEDRIVVSITDHGSGISEELKKRIFSTGALMPDTHRSTGIGLKNVLERLRLIYGEQVNFEIESNDCETSINITMPLNYIVPANNSDHHI
jgi:sensor histidine kinase YesM